MTGIKTPENCIDIVRPFRDELNSGDHGLLADVQIMGGIGSAALKHVDTEIIVPEKRIVTPSGFLEDEATRRDLDPIRPNGTLRDIDALILSSNPDEIAEVEAIARRTIGDKLDISIFGLRDASHLQDQIDHPFGLKALKTFVSDRYVYPDGRIKKALFPFAVTIDPATLEGWKLEIDGETFPVANPAAAILNYLTRSISGFRPKDRDKVEEMSGHVFGKAPELAEWIVDGPGKSQMELAAIFQTLRRSNSWPGSKRDLSIGNSLNIRAGSVRSLTDSEAFMLSDAEPDVQDAALLVALIKARGLGIGESNTKMVEWFQRFAEGRLGSITKNQ